MHNTHLGSHAPSHFNKLPMASDPHNFLHIKEVDGRELQLPEEGANNLNLRSPAKFQKYFGKKQAFMYKGYKHAVDITDPFLNSLSKEEKARFDSEMKKIWKQKQSDSLQHPEDVWYLILEGKRHSNGESKVMLYQDEQVFRQARDENYKTTANGTVLDWSNKACWFNDLESAKNYMQMARDEEGHHWNWPETIPVIWKNGPITRNDIAHFEGWAPYYEDEENLSS